MRHSILKILAFLVLFFVLLFISSRDKENYVPGSYKSTLYVDPAGYNVYLPALFQYNFIHNFPDKTDSLVAYGFMLNNEKKIITKFTYGVAFLQSPFYLAGLGVCKLFEIPNNGYSPVNNLIIDIAGIFYMCCAFFIWLGLLQRWFSPILSFLSAMTIFIGTNLFYYATIQPGMSHVYSFFLVSLSVLSLINYLDNNTKKWFFIFCISTALIVLTRPINIVFLPAILCFGVNSIEEFKERLQKLISLSNIFIALFISTLVFIPQFIYWKFAYGKFLADSYPGENFEFISSPQIKEFLFSPHNGLLVYSPLYLMVFALTFYMFKNYKLMGLSILLSGAFLIYLCASWYLYFFGCGFGGRNFVEFSGLLIFPIANFYKTNSKIILKVFASIAIFFSIFINLKLMHSWDVCYWGKNDWDWKEYKYMLTTPKRTLVLDSNIDGHIDSLDLYSAGITFNQNSLSNSFYKSAEITVDAKPLSNSSSAQLACMGLYQDSTIFYSAIILKGEKNKWSKYKFSTALPFDSDKDYQIRTFIFNVNKEVYLFRNLEVKLR